MQYLDLLFFYSNCWHNYKVTIKNIDIKKYKREWAILLYTFVLLFMITLIFLVFTKNISLVERSGFFIFGLIFIMVGVMSIRHKISGGITWFIGSKAYSTIGLTELFTPKKITTDLRKPYRIGKWAVVEGWVFVFIGIFLLFLTFRKSRPFFFLYTQVCKIRGGEMVDRGPIDGCFLKNKDGTFYIMGSRGEDLCKMPDCIY